MELNTSLQNIDSNILTEDKYVPNPELSKSQPSEFFMKRTCFILLIFITFRIAYKL